MTIRQFFKGRSNSYRLFQLVKKYIKTLGPVKVKAMKTQISFGTKRKFAWVWLPQMWIKMRPETSITLTFSLKRRIKDKLIEEAVNPFPGHWTHHVVIAQPADFNATVRGWLKEAYKGKIAEEK